MGGWPGSPRMTANRPWNIEEGKLPQARLRSTLIRICFPPPQGNIQDGIRGLQKFSANVYVDVSHLLESMRSVHKAQPGVPV